MSNDGNSGLIESFHIDDGELDGLTPQECFVLGYELASICAEAEHSDGELSKLIHAENLERIKAALRKRGREFSFEFMAEDQSEMWVQLTIKAR